MNNRDTSRKVPMSGDFTGHLNSAERNGQKDERKIVFALGESMLNNDSKHGVFKQHPVKVTNFPGATPEKINKEIDDILQSNPDLVLLVYADINNLATKNNSLNNLRKLTKKGNELSPKTKLAFSKVIVRKDKVILESSRKNIL